MTLPIEKLERVMWRLRRMSPVDKRLTVKQLKIAIMREIGTDQRTYYANKKALKDLGWIKAKGTRYIILTDKDLTEGF